MSYLYAVEAEGICKNYGEIKVLNNISIYIPEGVIYGLLGPNGAGKTTFMRIINRIIFPDKGKITICGYPYFDFPTNILSYLPEERGLYKKMKVKECILFLAQIKGVKMKNLKKFIQEKMEEWEMYGWENKRIEELSKGMQQKVQLLAAIINFPKILTLDEPFSGLDPINASMIKNELQKLTSNGTTIILSTHDMSSVEEICQYVCLINKGKKVLDGEVSKLKYYYRTDTYEMFLLANDNTNVIDNVFSENAIIVKRELRPPFIYFTFKMKENKSGDIILEKLKNQAGVEIVKYERILPSLRDIFIQKVMGDMPQVELNQP